MLIALLVLLVISVLFGPQLWARYVLRHYSGAREDIPGTGAELARHLLDRFDIRGVKVEKTEGGDHYDPAEKVVRLSEKIHGGRSLTAVAVATHEVGHAIQDHQGYRPLRLRTNLVRAVQKVDKLSALVMLAIPVVALLTRSPVFGALMFVAAVGSMGVSAVIHLITLPVEWDASFGKALPILKAGHYISEREERGARRILKACALTYLAGALASLLNLSRWIAALRR